MGDARMGSNGKKDNGAARMDSLEQQDTETTVRRMPAMTTENTISRPKPKAITPGRPILAPNDQDTGATENALLLGIDLGTSRSRSSR